MLLQGIWIGMICGTFLQTLILLFVVSKTNWNKEARNFFQLTHNNLFLFFFFLFFIFSIFC